MKRLLRFDMLIWPVLVLVIVAVLLFAERYGVLYTVSGSDIPYLSQEFIEQSKQAAHRRTECVVLVDGRQAGYSRGMFLEEMAALFENLGCKAAYNLDGGHCSFMTMGTVQPIILTSRKRRFQMVSLLRRDCK